MSKSLFTTIIEEIAPTTETVGVVGQLYLDTVEKKLYQCVAITTETVDEVEVTSYQWSPIGGVAQEDFDKLVHNETQIKSIEKPDLLLLGGGKRLFGFTDSGIAIGNGAEVHTTGNIAIGKNAKTQNSGAIAIGNNTSANGDKITIGNYAVAYGNNKIQFGNSGNSSADHTGIGSVNFGGPFNSFTGGNSYNDITLYNKTVRNTPGYHKLAFDEEVSVLTGEVAPDSTIVARVGQFYLDTAAKKLYQCTAINTETIDEVETTTYEWQPIGVSEEEFNKVLSCETQLGGYNSFKAGDASTAGGISIGADAKSSTHGIALGYQTIAGQQQGFNGVRNIAIGCSSGTTVSGINDTVSLGSHSHASATAAIQLGAGTNSKEKSVQIYNDNIYDANTHTATLQNIEQNGNPIYATLKGETDPTTGTVGSITQLYLNTNTKTLVQCVNITSEIVEEVETFTYEWKEIGSGNGTGNVDLTGYATEDYVTTSISGKAEQTSLDAIINNETQISTHSAGSNDHSFFAGNATVNSPNCLVAIGKQANAYGFGGVSIGGNSSANQYSVGLGYNAKSTSAYNIQLGSGTNSKTKSLQVLEDNIYDANTHTLTVQNIDLNGTDINTIITNALPTLTSQLTNDSGYLTAADLTNSSVTVGETETTMEEIATMATNSIQVDDAATASDIDSLFETTIPENIVQEGTDVNVASTEATITQNGTNLDIGE